MIRHFGCLVVVGGRGRVGTFVLVQRVGSIKQYFRIMFVFLYTPDWNKLCNSLWLIPKISYRVSENLEEQ